MIAHNLCIFDFCEQHKFAGFEKTDLQ